MDVLDPATNTQLGGSLIGGRIEDFLKEAESLLHRVGRISETTKAEVDATREAWEEAAEAIEPARQLFDLVVAARLGEIDPPVEINAEAISMHAKLDLAEEVADELQALHLPIAFPEVFLREKPGFDCILGNPPWQEATVEELNFWALRHPGLKSLGQATQKLEVARLRRSRLDLVAEYEQEVEENEYLRRVLLAGPFPGMGSGDPDLYKAFCWRFWQLCREGGAVGVVLPRSALSASGSTQWRETILSKGAFIDVTMLTNTAGWVFDDAEHRYTMALVSIRKGEPFVGQVTLSGPFASHATYLTALRGWSKAEFSAADLMS